jgi:hypothetical protein
MNSLGEKLAVGAVSNKLLCISYCGWPVTTVITIGARMYFFQEFNTVFLLDALHQYFCFRIFAPQLTLDHQVLSVAAYKAFIFISIRVSGAIC